MEQGWGKHLKRTEENKTKQNSQIPVDRVRSMEDKFPDDDDNRSDLTEDKLLTSEDWRFVSKSLCVPGPAACNPLCALLASWRAETANSALSESNVYLSDDTSDPEDNVVVASDRFDASMSISCCLSCCCCLSCIAASFSWWRWKLSTLNSTAAFPTTPETLMLE